ncbi:MAG TPA: rhodanese-like domain-containing protein [Candidatus Binatia bacterium]|nr:rhodanese-like domain-containing protein [Candidatus Binatia bacterium]
MADKITCGELASMMAAETLHAVFDVRERGEFNVCQIAGATSLPRSQIEFRIAELVPNAKIPIVVYDDDSGRAGLAARTLAQLSYLNVSVLEGGLTEWANAGYPTASGVNVPSKAFGEKVHHERNIPEITPEELRRLQLQAGEVLIFDARTPEEYRRFCIPGGVNVPGGDLVLWAEELKQKREATLVVNCAGRTRSIIGAAILRRLGVGNVRALKNGTMGWVLAGLELETKPSRETPEPPQNSRAKAATLAWRVAEEENIPSLTASELNAICESENTEAIYLVDVRSESEYTAGHIPRSLSVPGGQAVQRADDFIAVRHSRVVFISERGARAVMAAYWYRQMGFRHALVLDGGLDTWRQNGGSIASGLRRNAPLGLEAARKLAQFISPTDLKSLPRETSPAVLDVGSSLDFESGHIPGAKWISRGWLEFKIPEELPNRAQRIVLSCPDGQNSILAAGACKELGYENVLVLDGGLQAWKAVGYPTEAGLASYLSQPNDIVLSPSVRGDKDEMKRYLDWETKLGH